MTKLSQLLLVVFTATLGADWQAYHLVRAAEVDFARDIRPILARRCYACHGPDLQEGSFRFDDRSTLLVEADTGEIPVVPGHVSDSELIRRISVEDESERMPPEGDPLSAKEIALLRSWIDAGAEYEQHWAFQPVQNPAVPAVEHVAWPRSPLDRFILARLESAELAPVSEASPETLIRRVYLDVTGLPPAPETVRELTSRWSDNTYEDLVDRLLADPAFGDRWARNWLDVVRYAETNSFERDGAKPNAWKYRDYVIRALNADKPYDQFIREQIAGDELDEVTDDSLTATGFYRLGIWDDEPADPKQALFDGYDDLVTTAGQGILGLTFNCARCHDHKIDPITQKDYYSLVAFMRDVTPYGVRSDQTGNNQVDLDPDLAKRYEEISRERKRLERETRQIEQAAIEKMPAPDQRATEGPKRAATLRAKLESYVSEETFKHYSQLKQQMRGLNEQRSALPEREQVLGLAKLEARPPTTHVLTRGSPHVEGDEVGLVFPGVLGGGSPEVAPADANAKSAGRRRVLADWLAGKENWMTARVIVNRLWLHYFGRGIVRSPNNFGLMGDPPTHPQLIDYLAVQLMDSEWYLKRIHREILLSSTYRMATHSDASSAAVDPDNNLFWRQNLRRLSAEQVRDSVLSVTDQINEQAFGPSIYVDLSAEVLASQSRPGHGWGKSSEGQQARRSIYIHVKRSLPVPMLSAFDFPETDISCEARFLTTQPGQALTMLNSEWMQRQSQNLLERLQRDVGNDLEAQVSRALELCTASQPQQNDVMELVDLVGRLQEDHELSDQQARRAMCLVALNLNQFLYVE